MCLERFKEAVTRLFRHEHLAYDIDKLDNKHRELRHDLNNMRAANEALLSRLIKEMRDERQTGRSVSK